MVNGFLLFPDCSGREEGAGVYGAVSGGRSEVPKSPKNKKAIYIASSQFSSENKKERY